jgi:hypothetical protein
MRATVTALFLSLALSLYHGVVATTFTGNWVSASDATDSENILTVDADWSTFAQLFSDRYAQNLRLDTARTYVTGPDQERKWAGVWRAGTDGSYFYAGLTIDTLITVNQQLYDTGGLLLKKLETWTEGGVRYWAGIWRGGSGGHLWNVDMDINSFGALFGERHEQGWRLIDIVTYIDQGQRKWGGIWVPGDDGEYLYMEMDDATFTNNLNSLHSLGYTVTSLVTYNNNGFKYAAVWRSNPGSVANWIMPYFNSNGFQTQNSEFHQQGLSLSTFDVRSCDRATYNFNIDTVHVIEIASYGSDTIYISASLAISGRPTLTGTRYYGDHTDGDYLSPGNFFADVPLADDEVAVFSYVIVNNGHDQSEIVQKMEDGLVLLGETAAKALAKAGADAAGALIGGELGTAVVPLLGTALGALAGWLVDTIGHILFANCDEVVATGVHAFKGSDLCAGLQKSNSIVTYDYSKGNSICGDPPEYGVWYSVN